MRFSSTYFENLYRIRSKNWGGVLNAVMGPEYGSNGYNVRCVPVLGRKYALTVNTNFTTRPDNKLSYWTNSGPTLRVNTSQICYQISSRFVFKCFSDIYPLLFTFVIKMFVWFTITYLSDLQQNITNILLNTFQIYYFILPWFIITYHTYFLIIIRYKISQ